MQASDAWGPPLSDLFSRTPEVAMAFLFGSAAKQRMTDESDVDVAVYFCPDSRAIDVEEPDAARPRTEEILWSEVERITGRNADLVVLNRAPALLASAVLEEGIPLVNKDPALARILSSAFRSAAEDFREIDRDRLARTIDFLDSELADSRLFQGMTRQLYETDSSKRRNVERWVENIVNASIDQAKIMLASRQAPVPETYRQALQMLETVPGVSQQTAETLAAVAKLRNILAHQYVDVRWGHISKFLREAVVACEQLFAAARTFSNSP
jgi:uncharacterized protein YutE (UPF0331/DUF86 family)/predicted nucleotidyltransferase